MRKINLIWNTRFFVFATLFSNVLQYEARNLRNTEEDCKNVKSQTAYSLSDMAGYWYGIEILEHVVRSRPPVDSCINVELQDKGANQINLIWREKNLEVTYKFVIENASHQGIWTSLGYQDVKNKPTGYDYEQFAGRVFVVKASDSNVVLTFCSSTKLYTLVLSKTYIVNSTELDSIHKLVTRFGVPPVKDVKRYCKNGAYNVKPQVFSFLFIVTVAFLKL